MKVEDLCPQNRNSKWVEAVPYVTVSQSHDGNGLEKDFPYILFLSAGGYGHVPVPLYKQDEEYKRRRPAAERKYVFNYVGNLDTAPRNMREEMDSKLAKRSKKYSDASFPERKLYRFYYGPDWRRIMAKSMFSLTPRGWGRTAFHVLETLQMGFITVQVYIDIPWIPYENLLLNASDPLVYNCSIEKLPDLVDELLKLPLDEIERKGEKIRSLYHSHFLPLSVMKQIQALMRPIAKYRLGNLDRDVAVMVKRPPQTDRIHVCLFECRSECYCPVPARVVHQRKQWHQTETEKQTLLAISKRVELKQLSAVQLTKVKPCSLFPAEKLFKACVHHINCSQLKEKTPTYSTAREVYVTGAGVEGANGYYEQPLNQQPMNHYYTKDGEYGGVFVRISSVLKMVIG